MTNVLILCSGLALVGWLYAAGRLVLGKPWRYEWSVRSGEPAPNKNPPVSIIVPARNEADDLPDCLPTLLDQKYPEFEVIVVNDRSTDQTGSILDSMEDPNLRVIDGEPRPDDEWKGKPWAARQGAREARHDWLLFTDADIRFHSNLLSRIMPRAVDHPRTLHSLFPTVHCPGIFQKMVVPLLGLFLLLLYPLRYVNDPDRPEALAAGGFMLFSRSLYEDVGGHRAVRWAIAEDRQLARRVQSIGGGLWVRATPGLSTVMYRSARETVEGLTKHLLEGLDNRWGFLLLLELGFLLTHVVPFLGWLAGFSPGVPGWVLFGSAMVLVHLIGLGLHRELPHSVLWGFTILPGLVLYAGFGIMALFHHLIYGGPRWKNRRLDAADRLEF